MGNFVRAANINEIAEGTLKKYQIQGTEILIARISGKFYATQNKCPHLGGDLSQGKLDGTIVTCYRHGSQFNLVDGNNIRWLKGTGFAAAIGKALKSPKGLVTYNTRIEGTDLWLEI